MTTHKKFQTQFHIKKNNALTDGHILKKGKAVLPDKLVNVLYWKYEECGNKFTITMVELRRLLGLKSIKDDTRIYTAIAILQTPLQLRNFSYKGKEVEWISAPFLSRAVRWKDTINMIEIELDEMMLEAFKQTAGYTPIDIHICNQFKTKFGLKIYEMITRYYHLPNKKGKGVGTIAKSIEHLNNMFGSNYKTKSELKRGMDRGILEIEKITSDLISCYFDNVQNKFVFSWYQKSKYPKLRIPYKRINELIEWYLSKNPKLIIDSIPRYKKTLKEKIINDKFNELDAYYKGLMQHKYNLVPSEYIRDGKYIDFNVQIASNFLYSI